MTDAESLDERLVQAALQLLADEGIERLTLRRLARRAGVSHSAPLRHFPSLAALRSEVAARGFDLLSEAIEKSGAQLPLGTGPKARLAAAGRAYVAIAMANPDLFALMFRPDDLDPTAASFLRSGEVAFEHLVRHVRAAQDGGWQPERDTRVLAGCAWSAFHGFASLWTQGAFPGAVPGASFEDALSITIELVLGGPLGANE